MEWVARAALIGIGATVTMDLWAIFLKRTFGVLSLDYRLLPLEGLEQKARILGGEAWNTETEAPCFEALPLDRTMRLARGHEQDLPCLQGPRHGLLHAQSPRGAKLQCSKWMRDPIRARARKVERPAPRHEDR